MENNNAIAVIPQQEIREIATAACKSGLFPMPNPEAAFMLMLVCQSEGLHPVQALKRYHVIKGRPTMRSDAMQAEFQRAGGKIEWLERTDKVVKARFSHPSGGSVEVEWTIEQAKQAGLTGKDVWRQFPRQMLTARVISEGVRTILPGIVTGIYTPEEIDDLGAIDITPKKPTIGAAIAEANATPAPKEEKPKKSKATPATEPEAAIEYKCSACGRTSKNPGACKCAEGKVEAKKPEAVQSKSDGPSAAEMPQRSEMQKEITGYRAKLRIQTSDWKAILETVGVKDLNAANWPDETMLKVVEALREKAKSAEKAA
jgi:hypothetical protein